MTQEIIEMAQECGLIGMRPHLDGIYSEALVAFAKLVAAKERLAQPHETTLKEFNQFIYDDPKYHIWAKEKEALADPMREVQRLGQEIEQEPPQRTWIGLEGAEAGWFCHTDFLNARKYTKKQREHICCQLLSEAQSWDIKQYQLMMHDSTKLKENT